MHSRALVLLLIAAMLVFGGCVVLGWPQARLEANSTLQNVTPANVSRQNQAPPAPAPEVVVPKNHEKKIAEPEAVCGDGLLGKGEECDVGTRDYPAEYGCPNGKYCSSCKCFAPSEPISCKANHLYAVETKLNNFIFTTLPVCGDDCPSLLGPDYKCDLRTCTCVPREVEKTGSATPNVTVGCGNGVKETGEECDGGQADCPNGYACGQCKCVWQQEGDSFTLANITGLKSEYDTGEQISLRVYGKDSNGSQLTQKGGYMAVAYLYDSPPTSTVDAVEGVYAGGYWNLTSKKLLPAGNYELKIILMCSKYGSACDAKYGAGKEIVERRQLTVKASCTDTDGGFEIYKEGNTTGILRFNGTVVTETDSCAGWSTLTEYYCDGSWVKKQSVNCEYGCTDGACRVGDAPLRIDTTILPSASVGVHYSTTLVAHGGLPPYSGWDIMEGQLPNGLSIGGTGEITGTPEMDALSSTFTVWVEDSRGNSTHKEFQLPVSN